MAILIRFLPVIYLAVINIAAFAVFGVDKWRAARDQWRVQERTVFILALLGGSIGAVLGMHVFHHKTRKWYFRFGIPAILILQIAAVVLFFAWDLGLFSSLK